MSTSISPPRDQSPEDHQRLFLPNPSLEAFSQFLVPHKVFVESERDILRRVARPGISNILSVVGPTGVGKTQLLNEVGGVLLKASAPVHGVSPSPVDSADALSPYLPVVCVIANTGRSFESRFKHLLIAILKQVNGVAAKLGVVRSDTSSPNGRASLSPQQIPIAQLEELVRSGLRERQTRAVLIDEAQHLAQRADAEDWQLVGNGLKLLGSISGTLIVLFGTSELLSLPSLTGQLGRRTKAIHLRRYLWDDPVYKDEFAKVVASFAQQWPDVLPVKLLFEHLPFLYAGCVGCTGILSGWIYDAMALAEQEALPAVTLDVLCRTAHSEEKLRKIATEAEECEKEFAKERLGLEKLTAELCPSSRSRVLISASETKPETVPPAKKKPKPGNRKPTYDPCPAVVVA